MSDRVPFKADKEPELEPKEVDVNRNDALTFLDHSSYHRMCDFLRISDIDRRDTKIAEKISYLSDWAKKVTNSNEELDHMSKIKELIGDLGEPHIGLELLSRLHRYTRLISEKKRIDQEIALFKPL